MATVTIGVPVYRGERFLADALGSIQAQTFGDFEAVISLDGPDPGCEAICGPFLSDPRFRLVVQPQRLGWVGNLNALMAEAATPYWYYHQQDDLVDPRYLEVLLTEAERTPEAAVVYCDMHAFGTQEGTFTQRSVTGTASARLLALLYEHHPAVAFRGLTRVEALRLSGGIRENSEENFAADTTWMAGVARWGELRRVPEVLYGKRYHEENVHTKWSRWPAERRLRAWTVHCADMLEHAMQVEALQQERRLLWLAAISRLVAPRLAAKYVPAEMKAADRVALLDGFLAEVRDTRSLDLPGWLDAPWPEIEEWTRGFYWLPASGRQKRSLIARLASLRR